MLILNSSNSSGTPFPFGSETSTSFTTFFTSEPNTSINATEPFPPLRYKRSSPLTSLELDNAELYDAVLVCSIKLIEFAFLLPVDLYPICKLKVLLVFVGLGTSVVGAKAAALYNILNSADEKSSIARAPWSGVISCTSNNNPLK